MGRILGPFPPVSLSDIQVSPLGVVPKKGWNKWRLILDLSSPEGHSVNDGIPSELCSLLYISVDDAARAVVRTGRGALLAKVDIKSAYRIVEVHPEDRRLLGMQFDGLLFVDSVLPFGLRSAPKIFNALADALEWVVRRAGVRTLFHYLDDFLIVARPASSQCSEDLHKLLEVFAHLRVPIVNEKLEGPATSLTFLGIALDTERMELHLPYDKLTELQALLTRWHSWRYCRVRDLRSLAGKLQHASKVVRPGRTFLRRMFELLKGTKRHQPLIRLNASFRSDLVWWYTFLERWNGVAMLEAHQDRPADHHLFTDASGSLGCGAWSGRLWFQYLWPEVFAERSIAVKELLPIVLASIVWGSGWRKQSVLAHCDNQSVVDIVNSGYSKDSQLMHLLRSLFFITAHLQITLRAVHIPGVANVGADAISRDNLIAFHLQVPTARPSPTPLPAAALDLLVLKQPDWTSPSWPRLFRSSLRQD